MSVLDANEQAVPSLTSAILQRQSIVVPAWEYFLAILPCPLCALSTVSVLASPRFSQEARMLLRH